MLHSMIVEIIQKMIIQKRMLQPAYMRAREAFVNNLHWPTVV